MRRDKNGQFLSNKPINRAGMKLAEKEKVEGNMFDHGKAAQEEFYRHLVDGDMVYAQKALKLMSIETRIESLAIGLDKLNERMEYFTDRLDRWMLDVQAWDDRRFVFEDEKGLYYLDGYCTSTSKGMNALRLKDFDSYKKYIKAGCVPYYKEYDVNGVNLTRQNIKFVSKQIDIIKRKLEDSIKEADQVCLISEEDNVVPELEKINWTHWSWVIHFSENKVLDIRRTVSKWDTSYIFEVLKSIGDKKANKEMDTRNYIIASGLLYKELMNRSNNPRYLEQYEGMKSMYRKFLARKENQTKENSIVEELSLDEDPNGIHMYDIPSCSISEDQLLAAIDQRKFESKGPKSTCYYDKVEMEYSLENITLDDEIDFYLNYGF